MCDEVVVEVSVLVERLASDPDEVSACRVSDAPWSGCVPSRSEVMIAVNFRRSQRSGLWRRHYCGAAG